MPDYQKAKIYKIESYSNPELVYYGSTCRTLAHRMGDHRCDFVHKKTKSSSSTEVFECGDAHIVLVENYPCNSKEELNAREAWYIKNNECVNKVVPGRTVQEYRIEEREKIANAQRKYHLENKEKLNGYSKQYRLSNKDTLKEKKKARVTCGCGSETAKNDLAKHKRSQKHIKWEQEQLDEDDDENEEEGVDSDIETDTTGSQDRPNSKYIPIDVKIDELCQEIPDEPFYEGAETSVFEAFFCSLFFVLRHKMSDVGLTDLISMLCLLCPRDNYFSTHGWDQVMNLFKTLTSDWKLHDYCPKCNHRFREGESTHPCTGKKEDMPRYKDQSKKIPKAAFIEIPFVNTIRDLFRSPSFCESIKHKLSRKKCDPSDIEDIYDGENWTKISFLTEYGNLAFGFNTDGVQLFKSSKWGIWPVHVVCYDQPPEIRYLPENMILVGIWFGTEKPCMNILLEPLVDSFECFNRGEVVVETATGEELTPNVAMVNGTFDLPAKALVTNSKQYNGECGCGYCKSKGTTEGGRGRRVFPFSFDSEDRTNESMTDDAEEALATGEPVNGVKGAAVVSLFMSWNMVWSICVDYMHGMALGIGVKLMKLWFDSKYNGEAWYIGPYLREVDGHLMMMMPPSFVRRLPRSIRHRKYWKAAEVKQWMLVYGPIILHGILPEHLYVHYLMLVSALWILLGTRITQADLQCAHELLMMFYFLYEKFYGSRHCTLNVHVVRHLVDSVKRNGPLWVFSCFPYENKNGFLSSFMTGTKQVHLQIIRRSGLYIAMNRILNHLPATVFSKKSRSFLQQVKAAPFQDKSRPSSSFAVKIGDGVWAMNKPQATTLTPAEFTACTEQLPGVELENVAVECFTRQWIEEKQEIVHSLAYTLFDRRVEFIRAFNYDDQRGYCVLRRFLLINNDIYAVVSILEQSLNPHIGVQEIANFDEKMKELIGVPTDLQQRHFSGINRAMIRVKKWKKDDPVILFPTTYLKEQVHYATDVTDQEHGFVMTHHLE
eukprot:Lithocolla_globosa_v1_NODE_817_length_3237_cov_73.340981.p1 type:complete len:998 gc:universal NODE_817_length_3237_cov_73.340981:3077-84(-)